MVVEFRMRKGATVDDFSNLSSPYVQEMRPDFATESTMDRLLEKVAPESVKNYGSRSKRISRRSENAAIEK